MKKKQKNTFITQELFDYLKKKNQTNIQKHDFSKSIVLPKNSINLFRKHKNTTSLIYIYDVGFNNKNQVFPISNHINKTGINPIRNNQNQKIDFYDITSIYCFKKTDQDQIKIAECFGHKKPGIINKNDQYVQTKTLCNHVIAAYYNGYKNIFAFVLD
tara:strand:- start:432 stop:905 length:474 start_codon:yes stop_codon:yes gene_type:complete